MSDKDNEKPMPAFDIAPALCGDHEALNVTLDRSRSIGMLHITEEFDFYYDLVDEAWHGTVLDADGWRDLDEDDMRALVKGLSLDDAVKDHLVEMKSVKDLLNNRLLARMNVEQLNDPSWLFYAETMQDLYGLGICDDDAAELATLLQADTLAAKLVGRTVVVKGVENANAPEAYGDAEAVGFGFAPGAYRALQLIGNGTFPTSVLEKDDKSIQRLELAGMLAILEEKMPITVTDISNDTERAYLLRFGEDSKIFTAARIVVDEEPKSWLQALCCIEGDRHALSMVNNGYVGYSVPVDLEFLIGEALKDEKGFGYLQLCFEGHNGITGLVKQDAPSLAPDLRSIAAEAQHTKDSQPCRTNDGVRTKEEGGVR